MEYKPYRILVVDDEKDLHDLFRKRFRDLIKAETHVFDFAFNGQEALELIQRNNNYHLVFTDIKMPVMDGLVLLNSLKEMNSHIKTVVISAYDDIINIRTAMNRNAFDFLVKPISLEDLTLTLEKTIREYVKYMEGVEAISKLIKATEEKLEAIFKERQRLSRDLHDNVGSTLSSINIISKMALINDSFLIDENARTAMEKINERSQKLLDNMNDIVWNINPMNDSIEELLSRMREYASSLLEAKKVTYQIDFSQGAMNHKLSLEIKSNIYLIFKEAVNNLAKYSNCSVAKLSFYADASYITMIIADDGVGFDINNLKHTGGLRNITQRAEEINSILKIKSNIGQGTTIEFNLKMTH